MSDAANIAPPAAAAAAASPESAAAAAAASPESADLQLGAAVATDAGVAKLKALFDELDKNEDGGVSAKEWGSSMFKKREALSKFFGFTTLGAIGKLFNVADTDGNDSISFDEFLALAQAGGKPTAVAPPAPPAAAAAAAAVIDTSSLFNEDDIQFCAAIGTDDGVTKLKALFNELDKDSSGEVSSKEWGRSVYKQRESLSKFFGGSSLKAIGTLFSVADADGDDSITFDEFHKLAKMRAEAVAASAGVSLGDIQLSAAVSNDAGVAKLKALFDDLDKNGDGGVSGKEWGSSVSKKRDALSAAFGGDSLKSIGKLFSVADGDGDGSLSFDEFLALAQARGKLVIEKTKAVNAPTDGDIQLSAAVNSAEGLAKLKALFNELDKDSSGEVSSKEWGRSVYKKREALSKYFGGSSLKSIGTLFSVADADGNDSITFDEFVDMAKTRSTAIAAATGSSIGDIQLSAAVSSAEGVAKLKALFADLDKNGDGGVSSKEWGQNVYKKRDALTAVFGGRTLKAIGKLFTVADGDGDGSLNFEEFLALAHARAKALTQS